MQKDQGVELSYAQFDRVASKLINEYVCIMIDGFPENGVVKWEEKVNRLSRIQSETIKEMVKIEPPLREAFVERKRSQASGRH